MVKGIKQLHQNHFCLKNSIFSIFWVFWAIKRAMQSDSPHNLFSTRYTTKIHYPPMLLPTGYFPRTVAEYNWLIFGIKRSHPLFILLKTNQSRQTVNHPISYEALHKPIYTLTSIKLNRSFHDSIYASQPFFMKGFGWVVVLNQIPVKVENKTVWEQEP